MGFRKNRKKPTKSELLKTANRILGKGYMIKWSEKKKNWVKGKRKY